MNARLTVVGARGFVGSRVAAHAKARGFDVLACRHDAVPADASLGFVVYCSGIAWDAHLRPLESYELHAAAVERILAACRYERFVYVSSTRVYDRAASTSEDAGLVVRSDAAADTYALTKIAGEGLTLSAREENRVLRCSNVYGPSFRSGLFLSDVLRQLATTGRIAIRTSRASSKDYVSVEDVAELAVRVAAGQTQHRIYNVAAGVNTTHAALLDAIAAAAPFELDVAPAAPVVEVPPIDVRRVRAEFGFEPRNVLDDVPELVRAFVLNLGPAPVDGGR